MDENQSRHGSELGPPPSVAGRAAGEEDRGRIGDLSKKLHGFAKLGLKSDIETALAQGARLEKAVVRGESAGVAAMKAGHRQLAQWLFEQDGHPWRRAGTPCEFWGAMELDDPEWLAWLHAKRPGALAEKESSGQWSRGGMLVHNAMADAPRCLAWLIEHCQEAAAEALRAWSAPESSQRAPEPSAMVKAAAQGDFASADAIAKFALPLAEEEPFSTPAEWRNGRGFLAGMLLQEIFSLEDPKVLEWLLEKSPAIAAAAERGIPSGWIQNYASMRCDSQMITALRWTLPLKITLGLFAAAAGAVKCFDHLMAIPAQAEAFARMQSEPDAFAWEVAFATVRRPELVERMQAQGFDFSRSAGGLGYVGAMLRAQDLGRDGLSGAWLRMVGEKFPGQLDPSPKTGLTVFGEAIARGSVAGSWAAELHAAESVCQKAALRAQVGRSKPIKAAQRRSAKSRI